MIEHGGTTLFADVYGPPPRLLVYGAIDTAEALCRGAKLLGWTTIVADARARFATRERIPSADELLVAWPDEAIATVEPDVGTAIIVLTHDDKFDLPLLQAALDSEAFYIGALGSRRNQERRRGLLLEAGVPERDLERINGPAGLDIGAESPAETALSMLAEMLAVRVGRPGAPFGMRRPASTRNRSPRKNKIPLATPFTGCVGSLTCCCGRSNTQSPRPSALPWRSSASTRGPARSPAARP